MGMERNGEVVRMAAYAPLLVSKLGMRAKHSVSNQI